MSFLFINFLDVNENNVTDIKILEEFVDEGTKNKDLTILSEVLRNVVSIVASNAESGKINFNETKL